MKDLESVPTCDWYAHALQFQAIFCNHIPLSFVIESWGQEGHHLKV